MNEVITLSRNAVVALAVVTNFVGAAITTWAISWQYGKSKIRAGLAALILGGGLVVGQRLVGGELINMGSFGVAKSAIFAGALAGICGFATGAAVVWKSASFVQIAVPGPSDGDGEDETAATEDEQEEEIIPIEELSGEEIREAVDHLDSLEKDPDPEEIERIAYQLADTDKSVDLGSGYTTAEEKKRIDRSVLAPNNMSENKSWHTRNGDFHQILTAKSLPRFFSPGWLIPFTLSEDDIRISLHVNPRTTDSVKDRLQKRLTQMETTIKRKKQRGRTDLHQDKHEKNEINRMLEQITRGTTKIYDSSMYFEVRGSTREEMKKASTRIQRKARTKGLELCPLEAQQDSAQGAVAPVGTDTIGNTNAVQLEALSLCFNFVEPPIDDEGGIPYGFDNVQRPVIVNRWDISGHSKAVSGKVGSGKTYATKMALYRQILRENDIRTVIFDPLGDDFVDFARQLGGSVIEFGGGYRINPLEISSDGAEAETEQNTFKVKIRNVMRLFRTFLEEKDGITAREEGVLSVAIHYAYLTHGITPNPMTWDRQNPTIDDVIEGIQVIKNGGLGPEELKEKIPEGCPGISFAAEGATFEGVEDMSRMEQGVQESLMQIANPPAKFRSVAEGLEPKFESFKRGNINSNLNGHTNLELNSDIVVFDMSKFADTGEMPLVMQTMLNWAYDRAREDDGKIDVTFEEAHYLLRREGARDLINLFIRHARHFSAGLTLISQTAEEFLKNDEVQEIYDNCDIKKMFYQENVSQRVADYYDLSNDEIRGIQQAARGENSDHSECLLSTSKHGRRWIEIHTGAYEHHVLDDDLDAWRYLIEKDKITHNDKTWAENMKQRQQKSRLRGVFAPLDAIINSAKSRVAQAANRVNSTSEVAATDGGEVHD